MTKIEPEYAVLGGNVSLLKKDTIYQGIQIEGGKKQATIYTELPVNKLSSLFEYEIIDNPNNADYLLIQENDSCLLIHRLSKKLIVQEIELSQINIALQKIASWENLKTLQNPHSRINQLGLELSFEVDGQKIIDKNIEIPLSTDGTGRTQVKEYSIELANNTGKELYFNLLFISPLYGIINMLKGSTILPNGQRTRIVSNSELGFFREQVNDMESNGMFKLIASTCDIDVSPFIQKNFSLNVDSSERMKSLDRGTRFIEEAAMETSLGLDWTTKDINLRLIKTSHTIGADDSVTLANDNIRILPHPNLRANVSLSTIFDASRGVRSATTIVQSVAEIHGMTLFNLYPNTKSISPQIIELKNIEGNISAQEPLNINIAHSSLQENEILLPVAINDNDLIVIGSSQTLPDGSSNVYVERLPEPSTPQGLRNIGRAIKFCLMKLLVKSNPSDFFLLRWVDFDAQKPIRTKDNIQKKVADAKNILLLVHGIIGDTEGMFSFIEPITKSKKQPNAHYDLALAFDYECLNTPIEKIALNLIGELSKVGIKDSADKKVTIIAHSMGGLVSRIVIEKNKKGVLVDKLIMAGTPNGGSVLGKVPSYLALASDVLTLGLATPFLTPYLSWAAGLAVTLKKSDVLTVTLAQMKQDSDFIKELVTFNDPKVPYYILAGQIDTYQLNGDTWFARLGTQLALVMGNVFHKGKLHDIAVYTADIEKVDSGRTPTPQIQEVACPHILYYDEPASKAIMYKWLNA